MSVYEHFRKEERPFIEQVLEWKSVVEARFVHKCTDFLDPREQEIVSAIIGNNSDVHVSFFGGNDTTERKRALLSPPFFEVNETDYQISAYEVVYPHKFVELTHRDLLGSLMSLGLKREKFGDIYVQDKKIQIVVASEISSYVETNFQSVSCANVELVAIPFDQLLPQQEEWQTKDITASSLRLDTMLSEMFQMSRSKTTPFIEHKKVKVNWRITTHASFLLKEGDYLSVRGLGRSKIMAIHGMTKKEKFRITVGLKK